MAAKVEFGAGYLAGLTLASAMTFAYLALDHILKASKPNYADRYNLHTASAQPIRSETPGLAKCCD
jgi:hypothetical protein